MRHNFHFHFHFIEEILHQIPVPDVQHLPLGLDLHDCLRHRRALLGGLQAGGIQSPAGIFHVILCPLRPPPSSLDLRPHIVFFLHVMQALCNTIATANVDSMI